MVGCLSAFRLHGAVSGRSLSAVANWQLSAQLRAAGSGGMLARMRNLAAIVGAMSLVGCGETDRQSSTSAPEIGVVAPFPADDTSKLLNGELIEVPKSGRFLWNLQSIDAPTLTAYLAEKARISHGNGRVVVQFEPGTSPERVRWVRNEVTRAGFCKWRGCAEAPWRAVRPVVH